MTSPERVYDQTRSFLADHPDAEEALERLLEVDAEGTWTFEDTAFDSGRFGTLVSEEIVESVDDGYQLADRKAVQAAIEGEPIGDDGGQSVEFDFEIPAIDPTKIAGILVGFLVIVLARSVEYGTVFRDGAVVSPANDPYYYRHWQRELLELSTSATDLTPAFEPPSRIATRPLTHVSNWWVTALLGESTVTADMVAAWLPIVGTLALGVVLYLLMTRLTGDARIGIVAIVLLGLIPAHAVYTGLGFLEHRVHQYFWLGVMALSLVWLAVDVERRVDTEKASVVQGHLTQPGTWIAVVVLAVAIAASVHAWRGSALNLIPVGAYLALRSVVDVRRDMSPLGANLPAIVGTGLGALLAYQPYTRWGWHEADFVLVLAAALITAGAVAFFAIGEVFHRLNLHAGGVLVLEAIVVAVGYREFRRRWPEHFERIQERADDLLFREDVAEVMSLFSTDVGVIFGPLMQQGLIFYLAVPVLAWASWLVYDRYQPGYLVLVVFAWYYIVLATIQVRFAGQLSLFIAAFAAIAVVYLFAWMDVARPPSLFGGSDDFGVQRPDEGTATRTEYTFSTDITRTHVAIVAVIGLLLLAVNIAVVYGFMGQTSHDETYEAASAIDDFVTEHNITDRETFVLSNWGDNRMYNFFVNNEADTYGWAQRNYDPFLATAHPDDAYDEYGGSVGFVVLEGRQAPDESTQSILYDELGLGDNPTSNFQLIHSEDGVKAFALVPGATIEVNATSAVTVSHQSSVSGSDIEIDWTVEPDDGTATVTVAYPGTYEIGGESVTVTQADILDGGTVTVNDSDE